MKGFDVNRVKSMSLTKQYSNVHLLLTVCTTRLVLRRWVLCLNIVLDLRVIESPLESPEGMLRSIPSNQMLCPCTNTSE